MPTTAAWLGTTSGAFTVTTNWSTGAVPVAGDSIIFDGRATQALTGSPATSIQLASIKHYMSCTKAVGTAAAPLVCFADNVEVGLEATDGSSGGGSEFHIAPTTNIGSKMVVYNSPSVGTTGLDPVTLDTGTPSAGTHELYVHGGTVGVATSSPTAIATVATIGMTGGRLNLGAGLVTGWSLTLSGSGNPKAFTNSATSGTITVYAGEVTTEGIGLIAAITLYGGTCFCNHRVSGSASITTLTLGGNAPATPTIDFKADPSGITITNTTLVKGRIAVANPAQITFTNKPTLSWGNSTTMTISLS
jgi:hypothetical protein